LLSVGCGAAFRFQLIEEDRPNLPGILSAAQRLFSARQEVYRAGAARANNFTDLGAALR